MMAGGVAALVFWIVGSFVLYTGGKEIFLLIVAPLLIFVVVTVIVTILINIYINRRLTIIYKNIHQFKGRRSKQPSEFKPNEDAIDLVAHEVAQWAEEQENERNTKEIMEQYRREFLGNVSHELKTPIFSMQGLLHTLLDGGLDDPNINRDYVIRAARNADRLQTIVEDLESISRMESGVWTLDMSKFKIYDLLKEIKDELQPLADRKGIKITFKDSSYIYAMVQADHEHIRQVLVNLIDNSIKYGKEKGVTKLGIHDNGPSYLIEVSDNGGGIDAIHLKRVFDRFYRIDKSRSREQGGSGLGLAIVKHIIEAHNQTVNVRSTVGQGSVFSFTLAKA